jgi:hypothetical protein
LYADVPPAPAIVFEDGRPAASNLPLAHRELRDCRFLSDQIALLRGSDLVSDLLDLCTPAVFRKPNRNWAVFSSLEETELALLQKAADDAICADLARDELRRSRGGRLFRGRNGLNPGNAAHRSAVAQIVLGDAPGP